MVLATLASNCVMLTLENVFLSLQMMIHHTGHAMINVYQKVICVKENVRKVMKYVGTSVCPLVKFITINLAMLGAFLKTFLKSIIRFVMDSVSN